jgi:hypothetical protein
MRIDSDKLSKRLADEKKLIMQQRKDHKYNPILLAKLEGMLLAISLFKIHLDECEVSDNVKD